MNFDTAFTSEKITGSQLRQFKEVIAKLFKYCQERMRYQSERFGLPEAELRCLLLFGDERYLTAKGIARRMNVVKSRVTKIVQGLVKKKLIQRVRDPEDSRITLLTLTPRGQKKLAEVNRFIDDIHKEVLIQMHPEQRKMLLKDLDLLAAGMEAVKDLMV
ncbi:MAG: MarR family transcriptional regulator [Deltaproteobacteria bacterium]|nr:MarR family transcriptional regulator [Deltaproteobacteria bacterium]MBW1955818.1 MarR family transcriptional regulator [Deltaproteobacteria bacterium]MBW2040629.1 MarR family transcriptional regulator [Deltaproteobacteria bacterium]MBW2132455.1 MarR family transcriptional regulator [Deltaproteobacteria bacterium]